MISEMKQDDFLSLFPKSVLPRWILHSDLEKVGCAFFTLCLRMLRVESHVT